MASDRCTHGPDSAPDGIDITASASPVFTVSLSSAAASDITVAVSTADGTAVAPSDYAATSGHLRTNLAQLGIGEQAPSAPGAVESPHQPAP